MYISRKIASHLKRLAQQFPVIAVMGPRQSGKTTVTRQVFPEYAYVTMEDLDKRRIAQEDPRGFFATYAGHKGLIIDEVQEVPELLSYMQGIVDQEYRPGFFILTGSQNFLMYEKITQTLAGRMALLTLLPLSIQELADAQLLPENLESLVIKGMYPRVYAQPIDMHIWCTNYIATYVEKDVRQVLQITDVVTFQRFLKLCAARIGNLLNYAELARDCDISPNTAKAWISILESSYILKLLYPYHNNFSKRVIKSPKLYFYDTSLACSLLGIKTNEDLFNHPFKGALFESLMVSEIFKYNYNNNMTPEIYFWRDIQGHEIDVVIEKNFAITVPVEIKAGRTITKTFFKGLTDWKVITNQESVQSYIIYGGDEHFDLENGHVVSWKTIDQMLYNIYK